MAPCRVLTRATSELQGLIRDILSEPLPIQSPDIVAGAPEVPRVPGLEVLLTLEVGPEVELLRRADVGFQRFAHVFLYIGSFFTGSTNQEVSCSAARSRLYERNNARVKSGLERNSHVFLAVGA